MDGAHNALLDLEQLTEGDLNRLRERYIALAAAARTELTLGHPDTGSNLDPDSCAYGYANSGTAVRGELRWRNSAGSTGRMDRDQSRRTAGQRSEVDDRDDSVGHGAQQRVCR